MPMLWAHLGGRVQPWWSAVPTFTLTHHRPPPWTTILTAMVSQNHMIWILPNNNKNVYPHMLSKEHKLAEVHWRKSQCFLFQLQPVGVQCIFRHSPLHCYCISIYIFFKFFIILIIRELQFMIIYITYYFANYWINTLIHNVSFPVCKWLVFSNQKSRSIL